MIQAQEHGSRGRRALGMCLALGAFFGALAGAGVGAAMRDVGSWTALGVPAGITIALAIGTFIWKPRQAAVPTSWMTGDDDGVPVQPPARVLDKQPERSDTEAA